VEKIELIFVLNIINSIFVAKIIILSFLIIPFVLLCKKISSFDYYSLALNFFLFLFLFLFFIASQTKEIKTNTFYNQALKKEIHIPSIKPIEYGIKYYHILPIVSFILFLLARRFTISPFLILMLFPSILISLKYIYEYKNNYFPIIKSDMIDINNSLIISLRKDGERLRYHFKDNIFIADDYIFSDIISSSKSKMIKKSFFYLKYFDINSTIKNAFLKINKNAINKDIFIYTDKMTLYNIYSIFSLASYDIIQNKDNDILLDIDFIIHKINNNALYHKAITKKVYRTNRAVFNLSNGMLTLDNNKISLNNAFLVNKTVKKIQYDNNSPSKIVSIILNDKYMILCHQEYLKSFFIQVLIFKNYSSSLVDSVYNKENINIIKIKNPFKEKI
jgi:hypothetical protein